MFGIKLGGGEWNEKGIQKVVDTIHTGADYQESPERICAKCIRIFVDPHQPFEDCNHRTMTLLTHAVLDEFYPNIEPNIEKWEGVREKIGGWSEREIGWWIFQAIIERASIHLGERSNLRSFPSSQASNSSSVIKSKYTGSNINSLWQLHAEGVSMEDINNATPLFYERGWDVQSRPSKRYIGRFDMFIKRR